jgi:hypothetical protein
MPQREHRLDQARDAGGRIEMADIGLHRADGAVAPALRAGAKAWVSAAISMGSPSAVPVPWASHSRWCRPARPPGPAPRAPRRPGR